MQVGPAISPLPEEALLLDLKEYAAQPLTFLRKYLVDHGADATQGFITRVELYPFISDLLGEWLHRNNNIQEASRFLTTITREVIGSMTLTELCLMMQSPLVLLSIDGKVDASIVSRIFREFYLSSLAEKIELQNAPIDTHDLEQLLTATAPITEPEASNNNYTDFLSELKDAGVIIPPSAKERQSRVQAKRAAAIDEKPAPATRAAKPRAVAAKLTTRGVESMFSPDAQEKIMLKIFRNDADDYRRSMDLIDKAKDWKQASIYLDALFMRRKVDPYSKTATRLTDAVYARFNSVR